MSLLVAIAGQGIEVEATDPVPQTVRSEATRQGFSSPRILSWPGGHALWYPTPGKEQAVGCVMRGDRFAACVGTVHWRGLGGSLLLERLLEDFEEPASMPLCEFAGSFAILFSNGQTVWLFNDAVGLQKIYTSADRRVYSTSLLVIRSLLKQPQVNRLRAQEYVLFGSNHGLETPIDGVRIHDPTRAIELRGRQTFSLHDPHHWRAPNSFRSIAQATQGLTDQIAGDFASMVKAHGPRVGMALSGGFDSRLLLAALDQRGVQPSLYVYGAPDDEDVRVARAKAAALGMDIQWADKQALDEEQPALDRQRLKESIIFFDGLPIDGVFDRGVDRLTRLQQVQDGTLNLNGGGGEILRNFFYLPDRAYSADDLVGAFYSNWLPQAVADREERIALLREMADGILRCLGFDAGFARARAQPMVRTDVELVYSLFRVRFWMGRNNTVAARNGAFMTPLVSPQLVKLAAALPLTWKTYGDLECGIIRSLSPRVAAGPSGYGFDFTGGPTAAHRRYINATLYRPIALRRRSAQIRRMMGRQPSMRVPQEWLGARASCEVDWIDARFLTESAQVNRLMTLCALLDDSMVDAQ